MRQVSAALAAIALTAIALTACLSPAGGQSGLSSGPSTVGATATSGAARGAASTAQATATAHAATLPDDALDKIALLLAQEPASAAEAVEIMEAVIKAGKEVEAKYPDAADLYQARLRMVEAAAFLVSQKHDAASRAEMEAVAGRVLASSAPMKDKAQADYYLALATLTPASAAASDPSTQASVGVIRGFVDKYALTDAAGRAVLLATAMAARVGQKALQEELIKKLQTKYVGEEGVKPMLRRMGRHPDIGTAFETELTKLDGGKLSLPKDLLGKVVVVDFWATWCPPCRATIPMLRKTYDKYKDKGVEIVGISADKPGQRETLIAFVKANKMDWIQTYSGKEDDPTAGKYDIDALPAAWVIGKDGKVVFDGGGADKPDAMYSAVEKAIDKALEAK